MNKTEILIIGKNIDSVKSVVELIGNNKGWVSTQAATDENAIEKFHQRNFDVVLLANGINDGEERKLRKIFTLQNPDIIIVKNDGIDSSLLIAEITAALNKQRQENKPSFSFLDDALKNAGLHITIQ